MNSQSRIKKCWLCVLMALSSVQLMVGAAATWGARPEPPAASVPAAPGGIVVKAGSGKIVLTWKSASGATSYHVKRSTRSGGPYTQIATTTFEGYTNVGLSNGTRYYYVISSVNSAGQSANSGQYSGIPSNSIKIPSTPGGLTAAPGNGRVGLTWAAPSSATSYKIKRAGSSNGPFTQIATSTFAGYTDVGLQNGTTYYFAVSAVNGGGESANSAAVGAKPVASSSAVTSVSVSPATASSITSGTLPFKATVQGSTSNKSVTWKVVLGHINASGMYTAPSKAGTDTVTAVSNADPTKSDSTVVKVTTSAPPPPPDDPPPPAPTSGAGLPHAFFGLSYTQIEASHYPSVPFGGVRLWDTNTTWAQIESSRGSYNWTDLDIWLRNVSSHGQDAMYTFGRVPHWASSQPSAACPYATSSPGCTAPTSDLNSGDNMWKEFVTALVKHSLSSPALHIPYYEMWNEPDLTRNWTGTPAQMATMVKDAYAIIHSLDPKAKVIGPTPSTANQYGVHFLPNYYAAGAANAQDIVGLHAYLYNGSSFATNPSGITTSISQLKKLMATYGISSKPIWFTEGSWSGSDSSSLSDSQKAAYLAQEYMLMWSTGAVSRYYWYAWDSRLGTLWTPSGGMTQAGHSYNYLAEWLIGSTHASSPCKEDSSGTWTCSLTLSTGYPGEIIWNANTSKTITVDASFLTSRTLVNSTVHSISNHQVSIGPLPVLIIKGQAQ
jgi:fibronectin type 3 domain-containing protein